MDNHKQYLSDTEIIEVIKSYIAEKLYNYAVMIDGEWGFRVIIVTVANSLGNIRVFELLPKLKTKKYGWCIA